MKKFLLVSLCALVVASCDSNSVSSDSNNKNVRYTVNVVAAANSAFSLSKSLASAQTVTNAVVYISQNDKVDSAVTGSSGLAVFTDLRIGTATVTIKAANYSTLHYVVSFTSAITDSANGNNYDAATMVTLFPNNGVDMDTVSGTVRAELDVTNTTYENAPAGTKISAVVTSSQLADYVNHSGLGQILSVAYENMVFSTTVSSNGNYSVLVPATASGLSISLMGDDFKATQILTDTTAQQRIYKLTNTTMSVVNGKNYVMDLTYIAQ